MLPAACCLVVDECKVPMPVTPTKVHVAGQKEQAHLPGREGALLDQLQQLRPVLLTGCLRSTQMTEALQEPQLRNLRQARSRSWGHARLCQQEVHDYLL